MPQRPVVEQLASRLFDTPTPLTPEQAEQLLVILKRDSFGDPRSGASPTTSLDGVALPANATTLSKALAGRQNGEWARLITDAAVANAAGVLAPPQLAALKQLQKQQLIQIQLAPALLGLPAQ